MASCRSMRSQETGVCPDSKSAIVSRRVKTGKSNSDKLCLAALLDLTMGEAATRRRCDAVFCDRPPRAVFARRRADSGRTPRLVYEAFMTRRKKRPGGQKNACVLRRFAQITILPNTHVPVVVCRSAGIWTRGQSTVARKDRQPEANRRTPPNGGRDLKQRRTGLFRPCRPSKGRLTEEACLSCRACGRDFSPPNDGCDSR